MPANLNNLTVCLSAMKAQYLSSPVGAVRGSSFIYHLHDYCVNELASAISPGYPVQIIPLADMNRPLGKPHTPRVVIEPQKPQLMVEATLFGSHKSKDVDIVLSHYASGPLIIIGIRSQMSSVGKNIENYYEGIIGECISLHDRFPMATIGYVYLLPKRPIKAGLTNETVDLDKAEQLFLKITGREDWHSPHDKYEHFAFLKVDFDATPPLLIDTVDTLKIDSFFDKLIDTHNDRNVFNQIPKR